MTHQINACIIECGHTFCNKCVPYRKNMGVNLNTINLNNSIESEYNEQSEYNCPMCRQRYENVIKMHIS